MAIESCCQADLLCGRFIFHTTAAQRRRHPSSIKHQTPTNGVDCDGWWGAETDRGQVCPACSRSDASHDHSQWATTRKKNAISRQTADEEEVQGRPSLFETQDGLRAFLRARRHQLPKFLGTTLVLLFFRSSSPFFWRRPPPPALHHQRRKNILKRAESFEIKACQTPSAREGGPWSPPSNSKCDTCVSLLLYPSPRD